MSMGDALPGIFPADARVAFWCSGSRFRGLPVPIALTRSLGPMAYYFGVLYSVRIFPQPRSQLVKRLLHPSKGFVPSFDTNNKPTSILVNLTNPLTFITLTPGSLGWDSLLPPIIHSHHAFHIHSIHTRAPLTHVHSLYIFLFSIHFNTDNPLTTSPKLNRAPRHPLPKCTFHLIISLSYVPTIRSMSVHVSNPF